VLGGKDYVLAVVVERDLLGCGVVCHTPTLQAAFDKNQLPFQDFYIPCIEAIFDRDFRGLPCNGSPVARDLQRGLSRA
jgi:hypothetical protein